MKFNIESNLFAVVLKQLSPFSTSLSPLISVFFQFGVSPFSSSPLVSLVAKSVLSSFLSEGQDFSTGTLKLCLCSP